MASLLISAYFAAAVLCVELFKQKRYMQTVSLYTAETNFVFANDVSGIETVGNGAIYNGMKEQYGLKTQIRVPSSMCGAWIRRREHERNLARIAGGYPRFPSVFNAGRNG